MPLIDLPPPAVHAPHHCVRGAHFRDVARPGAVGSVVSTTRALRVHFARAGDDALAREFLEYLELAWTVQVDQLGFRPPVLPDNAGGPELDVYLASVGDLQAWVEPASWVDPDPGDGLYGLPSFVVIDQDLPAELRASYAVHEFNHVLQYATDAGEMSLNLWEGTAVAAQKWTLGAAGAWDADVDSFQEAPWAPSLTGDSYVLWEDYGVGWLFEYGAALWVLHLDEVLGAGDGGAGPALWAAAASESEEDEPDVVDAVQVVSGQDLAAFLSGLALTRWKTGDRFGPGGLAEAEGWGARQAVPVARSLRAGALPAEVVLSDGVMVLGQAFVTLDLDRITGPVTVNTEPSGTERLAVAAFLEGPTGWVLQDLESGAAPSLQVQTEGASSLAIALTNLGPEGWDGSEDPYGVATPTLTIQASSRLGCGCGGGAPSGALALLGALVALTRRRGEAPRATRGRATR